MDLERLLLALESAIRNHSQLLDLVAAHSAAAGPKGRVVALASECDEDTYNIQQSVGSQYGQLTLQMATLIRLESRLVTLLVTKAAAAQSRHPRGPEARGSARGIPHSCSLPLTSREAGIQAGRERLLDRLHSLGLTEVPMADDGNCQFRALAHQFYGTADLHRWVRHQVVQHIRDHPDRYSVYFDGAAEFETYLADMAAAEWGDELTLKACSDQFQAVVHLVMSTSAWYRRWDPTDGPSARDLVLSYLSPVHYNSVVPPDLVTPPGSR
jgi:hypothetical protein